MTTKLAPGSIAAFVSKELHLHPKSAEFLKAYSNCIKYILGLTTAFNYQKNLKPLMKAIGKSSKVYRLQLLQNPHMFQIKLFTLRLALCRSLDIEDARSLQEEFQIKISDAKRILFLLQNDVNVRVRLRKIARALNDRMDLTSKFAKELFERVYKSVHIYVRAIVYRKLRFLAKSENLDIQDLIGEVMVKVVQAYYKLMPTDKTDAYVGNYLRRAAHNHAMNMIAAGTSQKRGRLINAGVDGKNQRQFSMIVLSENQMNVNKTEEEVVGYDEIGGGHNPIPRLELKMSVSKLLNSARGDAKKFRFLSILMGKEHRRFTDWLRQRGLCGSNESNTDIQLRVSPKTFNKWAAKFMHLPNERVSYIIKDIRHGLGGTQGVYDDGYDVNAAFA